MYTCTCTFIKNKQKIEHIYYVLKIYMSLFVFPTVKIFIEKVTIFVSQNSVFEMFLKKKSI